MTKKTLQIILLFLLLPAAILAADTLEEEQLLEGPRFRYEHTKIITEDPFPVEPGAFEIEITNEFVTARRRFNQDWQRESRPTLRENVTTIGAFYGISPWLDIGIEAGYAYLADREETPPRGRGITDLTLISKILLLFNEENERADFALGYIPSITFPTGTRDTDRRLGTTERFYAFDNRIAMVRDWGDLFTSNLDLGYTWFFGPTSGDTRGEFSTNAAVGYHLTEWLQPVVETGFSWEFLKGTTDANRVFVLGGVVMPISDLLRVDFGVRQDLAGRNVEQATEFILRAAFTF